MRGGLVERLFTLKQAAAILAVSAEFLKKLQRNGRLHIVRLGRAIRVSERELERLCREEFRR
jgi:excisionase family DNA binding protein